MKNIKAILLDLGGTVFDWETTVREGIQQLAIECSQAVDGTKFANDWGEELFRIHSSVRAGDLPWMNFDDMHVIALNSLEKTHPVLRRVGDKMELVKNTWHRLNAQSGSAEGVDRLRTRYTVVCLTNLSWASVVSSSKTNQIQWDGILSCEFLGFYKPALQAYLKGVSALGLKPHECLKISYDGVDLEAAQAAGLKTAQLETGETELDLKGFGGSNTTFDTSATDLLDLCDRLGV
ncbi:MAG: HAD family hydrolase [Rhizobiaceae bacterium]